MTTAAEVDRLAREVADLRAQVLQRRYGTRQGQIVLVIGGQDAQAVVEQRLAGVPRELRRRIAPRVVELPWLTSRKITGSTA